MGQVETRTVGTEDDGLRLDRWFKRHYPAVGHGSLQKLLRTGQIRLDGKRVKAGARLEEGQEIRIPPLQKAPAGPDGDAPKARKTKPAPPPGLIEDLKKRVLYQDEQILAIDKPAGLAVQGGTNTRLHIDGLLDELRFGAAERPRLVHRLDKDTSGVLVFARTAKAARALTEGFRDRETRKLYWALVAGVPTPEAGLIDMPLAKAPGRHGEKMRSVETGKFARSAYRIIDHAGRKIAWLAMEPLTGRTHQLRAHAALALETPIVGDGKYGGQAAYPDGLPQAKALQLHARAIRLPRPAGDPVEIAAPLPATMGENFRFLGFDPGDPQAGFLEP